MVSPPQPYPDLSVLRSLDGRQSMNWFQQHRMEWIAETLRVFGTINRKHLMLKFGISEIQAALDFKEFQKLRPGAMEYDTSTKRYTSTKGSDHARKNRSRL
jgi:hypothetical protein